MWLTSETQFRGAAAEWPRKDSGAFSQKLMSAPSVAVALSAANRSCADFQVLFSCMGFRKRLMKLLRGPVRA